MLSYLFVLGEPSSFELRIDQGAVETDLEAAPIGRNQRQFLDPCLEFSDELVGQTDRLGFVVSSLAIDKFDFHGLFFF